MKWTIQEIANLLDGKILGNNPDSVSITHPCVIQEGSPGGITFVAHQKYAQYIYTTKASVVLVKNDFKLQTAVGTILLLVDDPYISFTRLLTKFYEARHAEKIAVEFPSYIGHNVSIGDGIYRGAFSYIGDYARIGNHVKIYPHVYIGDYVVIGDNTILYSGAKIYAYCNIGNHCIIHSGAVIGSDGFGFAPNPEGYYEKIPSLGNVVLEDEVEIGANTTIDSATIKSTQIQQGVKIDNLVQLAHNVTIGKHTVIAAQTGIAGSTDIGNFCRIGGQTGIVGHVHISDHTTVTAKAGISKSVKQKHMWLSGAPAFESKKYWSSYAHFKNLPNIVKRLEQVEKMIDK